MVGCQSVHAFLKSCIRHISDIRNKTDLRDSRKYCVRYSMCRVRAEALEQRTCDVDSCSCHSVACSHHHNSECHHFLLTTTIVSLMATVIYCFAIRTMAVNTTIGIRITA